MKGYIALLIRTFIGYPLGALAAAFQFIEYDPAAAALIIDVNAATTVAAGAVYAAITGGTFAWSRWAKMNDGET